MWWRRKPRSTRPDYAELIRAFAADLPITVGIIRTSA
jgi:hypothetical protein